ncbi:formimidoylglutamate deiminase, partial [Acidovorax cattleyae]|nr:formimidoylglutamate deiminase [Paracidovorax cattleyae]
AAGHLPSPGAQAGLAQGAPADFVTLDPEHIALRGLPAESQLAAHVFASHRTSALDAVWTAGVQRVTAGRHAQHRESAAAFAAVRSGLLQS